MVRAARTAVQEVSRGLRATDRLDSSRMQKAFERTCKKGGHAWLLAEEEHRKAPGLWLVAGGKDHVAEVVEWVGEALGEDLAGARAEGFPHLGSDHLPEEPSHDGRLSADQPVLAGHLEAVIATFSPDVPQSGLVQRILQHGWV